MIVIVKARLRSRLKVNLKNGILGYTPNRDIRGISSNYPPPLLYADFFRPKAEEIFSSQKWLKRSKMMFFDRIFWGSGILATNPPLLSTDLQQGGGLVARNTSDVQ